MSTSVHDPLLAIDPGMGKDRRRFLIVSVFDFCLITILWLICTVTKGTDWPTVFLKEINIFEPKFLKISLFDIVIIAIFRMLVLLFCYALLLVGHWLPVAATTAITTSYLVVKVLFFFSENPGGLPQYLLVLSSLTIAWFELWLVPFRVLPRERRQMIVPEQESPTVVTVRRTAQTDDEFRSAMEYSSGSESDDNKTKSLTTGRVYSKKDYSDAADAAELEAKQNIRQVESWKIVCRNNPEIRFSEEKRIYYLRVEANCSPQSLFKAVWKDNPSWNKQVAELRVILHIDPATELCYSVSAPALRGYIASRDFLDIRRMKLDTEKNIYEAYYVSVDSSILPPNSNKKIIRGFNGPNLVRVTQSPFDPNISVYEWLMDTDFKGEIPKRLIERTMGSFFFGYVKNLRTYLREHASEYP